VQVTTPSGPLSSNVAFRLRPQTADSLLSSFALVFLEVSADASYFFSLPIFLAISCINLGLSSARTLSTRLAMPFSSSALAAASG